MNMQKYSSNDELVLIYHYLFVIKLNSFMFNQKHALKQIRIIQQIIVNNNEEYYFQTYLIDIFVK